MSAKVSRRRFVLGAAAAGGGLLAAVKGAHLPPSCGGLFGMGEALTMGAQRLLLSGQPLAREFGRESISPYFPAINTVMPEDDSYQRLLAGRFADWRLPVRGLVDRPQSFSLADLRAFPARTQVTLHRCEQGWSAIAEWTGVQLSRVLQHVGARPQARYVLFRCVDDWWDSLDLFDALHAQTLLTYGMNGRDLPVPHGAPVRLRVERQLGYKSLKYLSLIEVVDSVEGLGQGKGGFAADLGYQWYAGI